MVQQLPNSSKVDPKSKSEVIQAADCVFSFLNTVI